MNVHKRQSKKPAFLKVFERADEKEDNPLLHSSSGSLFSAADSREEIDLPPLNNHHEAPPSTIQFDPDNKRKEVQEIKPNEGIESDLFSRSSDILSESIQNETVETKQSTSVDRKVANIFRSSVTQSSRDLMESQLSSEHSESLTMNDETDEGISSPYSMQVPNNSAKHAGSSAPATSKARERRSTRLLSGAKGLLRGVTSTALPQKTFKVELEAAAGKISVGVPNRDKAELLTTRDESVNIDSDDESEDKSKQEALQIDTPLQQDGRAIENPVSALTVSHESASRNVTLLEGSTVKLGSSRRPVERRTRTISISDDINVNKSSDKRSRRHHRQSSSKEPTTSNSQRRDKQQSFHPADTKILKEPSDSHRRRALHRPRGDLHAEKQELNESSTQTSSRQDRKKVETKLSKEDSTVALGNEEMLKPSFYTANPFQEVMIDGAAEARPVELPLEDAPESLGSEYNLHVGNAGEANTTPRGFREDKTDPQDPFTPQKGHSVRPSRTTKTTEDSSKRRSVLIKSFSDRILSAVEPGVEVIPTVAVPKSHKELAATDNDSNMTSIELLSSSSNAEADKRSAKVGSDLRHDISSDKHKEHMERSTRRKSRHDHLPRVQSPKRKTIFDTNNIHVQTMVQTEETRHSLHDEAAENINIKQTIKDVSLELLGLSVDAAGRLKVNEAAGVSSTEHLSNKPSIVDVAAQSAMTSSIIDKAPTEPDKIIDAEVDIIPAAPGLKYLPPTTALRGRTAARVITRPSKRIVISPQPPASERVPIVTNSQKSPISKTVPESLESNRSGRRLSIVPRRSRSPSPRQSQGAVFTWQRNPPVRATIAVTRRTARQTVRRGSIRTTDDNSQAISLALAKAYTTGSDAQKSPKKEENATTIRQEKPDLLSEELRDEYERLSVELDESRARVQEGKYVTRQLEEEIGSLQTRLEQVEQRRRV